jgi:hypothetical protein
LSDIDARRPGTSPNLPPPLAPHAAFAAPGDALPRPHDNCYWLLPGLVLAGEHPSGGANTITQTRLAALIDAGIRQFVDLTAEHERLPAYRDELNEAAASRGVTAVWHRFPIADYSVPDDATLRRALSVLRAALVSQRPVYLHCHGGIGRTGVVAGCLLVDQGFDGEAALALLDRKWQVMAKRARAPQTPETGEQREFVLRWRVGPSPQAADGAAAHRAPNGHDSLGVRAEPDV